MSYTNHNYTIMTTGKFTQTEAVVDDNRLALFAFADNDPDRTAWLTELAESGKAVEFDCAGGIMVGYLEPVSFGDVSVFHFHLAEVR